MRRPRAAFSSASRPAETTPAEGRTAPSPDGGGAPLPGDERRSDETTEGGGRLGWAISLGLLALIVIGGYYLRVHNNSYGLPYVYNYDEASHFTNRAVAMFHGDLNPGYFQNPTAFTYIVYVVLRIWYGIFGAHLDYGSVAQQFAVDPTPIWQVARTTTALIAMVGVLGVFFTGSSIWKDKRIGLIAAAILSFAFLPVVYGRIAVTDVGTFLPIAVSTWAMLRAWDDGRRRWYLLAGAMVGLAVGFKYTAGLAIVPLVLVAALRFWRDKETTWWKRIDLRYIVYGLAALVVAFAITTPYFFVKPISALYQLKQQSEAAGGSVKLGQEQQGGFRFYLDSFTWGLGWAAFIFAIVGAFFEVKRDRLRGLLLLSYPVLLFLYMGIQTRYFGRWLLPMYPVLVMLGAVGVVRVAELIPGRRWVLQTAVAAALLAGILIQPLIHDISSSKVLGREDTRQQARDYVTSHFPRSLRIVIEPAVPNNYYRIANSPTRTRQFVRGFIRDIRRAANVDAPDGVTTTYASTLDPGAIDQYRSKGFCLVMTMSLIRGRSENAQVPKALAYYKRLENESKLLATWTPFGKGQKPVPLHFDFSYNYYNRNYFRPGAVVKLYQLNNCREQLGKVANQPIGNKGLDKGIGSSFIEGAGN
jgi:hypothetical protein